VCSMSGSVLTVDPTSITGTTATGTGFVHVTSGVMDAASAAVNLASADVTGTLTANKGGSGAATFTAHGVLLGEGTSAFAATAAGNSGAPFLSGGAGADGAFGALNLAGGSNVITGVLPALNSPIANITVSPQGYFWGGTVYDTRAAGANATIVASANQVRAFQFVLPFAITVGKVTWWVSTSAGDTVDFGIYSADGTTKLVSSGPTVTVGTSATQTASITGVALLPGVYYFAWTETGTPSTTIGQIAAVATPTSILNANATKRAVTAGNAASAGTLPSSLGTLTTPVSLALPQVLFEP
jgi:hypothetical protein